MTLIVGQNVIIREVMSNAEVEFAVNLLMAFFYHMYRSTSCRLSGFGTYILGHALRQHMLRLDALKISEVVSINAHPVLIANHDA